MVVAALTGALLILPLRDRFPRQAALTGPCIELRVLSSSQKAGLLDEMVRAFEGTRPRVDGRCVGIRVAAKPSGAVTDALVGGWDQAVDGPLPDVWYPASTSWVVVLRHRLAAHGAPDIVPGAVPEVAVSPQVMAMPRPMAEALGWPTRPIGWNDIFSLARDPAGWATLGHPEWGRFRLGKTNPTFSTSGLNATVGAYFAATGLTTDLTVEDVGRPDVVEFVRGVESSVVHYGDTSLTFLQNLRRADDRGAAMGYISAVALQETSVLHYNRGNPTGEIGGERLRPPKVPLVAVYPKEGTLLADQPYVVLRAPWVNEQKRRAAAAFLGFLRSSDARRRFLEAGFRDPHGRPGAILSRRNGLLPDEPGVVLDPPSPPVLDRIQASWPQVRKRARVLIVIDVSGSMAAPVADTGATRLQLVQQAVTKSLDQFAPQDEVGVWAFSSDLAGDRPYLELVPIGPLGPRVEDVKAKIASLEPRGGTALYATLRAAVHRLREELDPGRINGVILLTDGRNEYRRDTDLAGALRLLRAGGEGSAVRVFPIAYGRDADRATLGRIAQASRTTVYDARVPASIDQVFNAAVANF